MRINTGGVALGENFFSGRRETITRLRELLSEGDVLILGPRRTGKTSIVQEYIREESAKTPSERRCIFIDLENIKELYEFYIRVLHAIHEASEKSRFFRTGFDLVKSTSNVLAEILPEGVKVGEILTGGLGSLTLKFPSFEPAKVEALNAKLREVLEAAEVPLVIVLDEFPELIWKLGRGASLEEQQQIRKDQTIFLLSALRAIRQDGRARAKGARVVIAGSVNLDNTLQHIGLLTHINDLVRLPIPYLTTEQAVEMMSELCKAESFTFDPPALVGEFIAKQFGRCSPFHLQLFAERLRNQKLNGTISGSFQKVDLENAYKEMLIGKRGPKALQDRLDIYYSKDEKPIVIAILKHVAKVQFETGKGPTEQECWAAVAAAQKAELDRALQSEILGKIVADDLIEFTGGAEGRLAFGSRVLTNFWYTTLVGFEFLAQ